MQQGHERWSRSCTVHGPAAGTLIRSMDMHMHIGREHRHGHTAWTGACSINMDRQHGHRHIHCKPSEAYMHLKTASYKAGQGTMHICSLDI
jgi:hypothetical protein